MSPRRKGIAQNRMARQEQQAIRVDLHCPQFVGEGRLQENEALLPRPRMGVKQG